VLVKEKEGAGEREREREGEGEKSPKGRERERPAGRPAGEGVSLLREGGEKEANRASMEVPEVLPLRNENSGFSEFSRSNPEKLESF
jgi:hypothetical protein